MRRVLLFALLLCFVQEGIGLPGTVPVEPIYVQSCTDTHPGTSSCTTGSILCNLRAAIAQCIEISPIVCNVMLSGLCGDHMIQYGPINVTSAPADTPKLESSASSRRPLKLLRRLGIGSVGLGQEEDDDDDDQSLPLATSLNRPSLAPSHSPSHLSTNSPTPLPTTSDNIRRIYLIPDSGDNLVTIDGSRQEARLFNIRPGGYINLLGPGLQIQNFGHSSYPYGGAVSNCGIFRASGVSWAGNKAQVGSVAFNGDYHAATNLSDSTTGSAAASSDTADATADGDGGGKQPPTRLLRRRGQSLSATMVLSGDECSAKGASLVPTAAPSTNVSSFSMGTSLVSSSLVSSPSASPSLLTVRQEDEDPLALYNVEGSTMSIYCCPTCSSGNEGNLVRSSTCEPTATPTVQPMPPSQWGVPTPSPSPGGGGGKGDDDDDDDLGILGLASLGSWVLAGVLAAGLLLCMGLLLHRSLRKASKSSSNGNGGGNTGGGSTWSSGDGKGAVLLSGGQRVSSTGLGALCRQFGVGGEVGRAGSRSQDDPGCGGDLGSVGRLPNGDGDGDLAQPFLRAALESMEGKPGDWLVDLRSLELGPMIGVGSSAHVFRASYFGQPVAAKRLPALAWKPQEVEAFLRQEAGLLVHLHHPSVIKFYGVGIGRDYLYMVTELCQGSLRNLIERANSMAVSSPVSSPASPPVSSPVLSPDAASPGYSLDAETAGSYPTEADRAVYPPSTQSLLLRASVGSDGGRSSVDSDGCSSQQQLLQQQLRLAALQAEAEAANTARALPPEQLLALALGIARGAEFLHSKGVVHRDLKPDNVLLNEQNEVKLCDFGISRMVGDRSGMTTAVGTPLLMAPELVFSDTASEVMASGGSATAVDVYSFGVLLWMMAAQRLNPYQDVDNPWTLLSQVTHGRRPPLPTEREDEQEQRSGPAAFTSAAPGGHPEGQRPRSAEGGQQRSRQQQQQHHHQRKRSSSPSSPCSSEHYHSASEGGSPRLSSGDLRGGRGSSHRSGDAGAGSGDVRGGGRAGRLSSSASFSPNTSSPNLSSAVQSSSCAATLSSLAALKGTNLLRMPKRFRRLMAQCWHPDASQRPAFRMIARELEVMQYDLARFGPALFFEDDGAGGGGDYGENTGEFPDDSGHDGTGYQDAH